MLLVHVIARSDLFVTLGQRQRQIGITFQIRGCRNIVERRERKHFAADLGDNNIRTGRRAFGRSRLAQAIFAKFREVHQEIREIRMSAKSLIATRSCFIESRSRNVTVSQSAESFSPSVSKSTVMPNGVPISSWRR